MQHCDDVWYLVICTDLFLVPADSVMCLVIHGQQKSTHTRAHVEVYYKGTLLLLALLAGECAVIHDSIGWRCGSVCSTDYLVYAIWKTIASGLQTCSQEKNALNR